jgi:hypothetical protein
MQKLHETQRRASESNILSSDAFSAAGPPFVISVNDTRCFKHIYDTYITFPTFHLEFLNDTSTSSFDDDERTPPHLYERQPECAFPVVCSSNLLHFHTSLASSHCRITTYSYFCPMHTDNYIYFLLFPIPLCLSTKIHMPIIFLD